MGGFGEFVNLFYRNKRQLFIEDLFLEISRFDLGDCCQLNFI
jgi:hypothetical protein